MFASLLGADYTVESPDAKWRTLVAKADEGVRQVVAMQRQMSAHGLAQVPPDVSSLEDLVRVMGVRTYRKWLNEANPPGEVRALLGRFQS